MKTFREFVKSLISERDKFDGRYDDDEVEDEKRATAVAREKAKQAKALASARKSDKKKYTSFKYADPNK